MMLGRFGVGKEKSNAKHVHFDTPVQILLLNYYSNKLYFGVYISIL